MASTTSMASDGDLIAAPLAQKRQAQRKHVEFSTRFLPSDGIPSYNALLDSQLGKRREFLLGNKHSLQHLQRTGAIVRVEEMAENPSQYVVIMNEKKPPLPASIDATAKGSSASLNHDLYGSSRQQNMDGRRLVPRRTVMRSESTPTLASSTHRTHKGIRRRRQSRDEREEDDDGSDIDEEGSEDGTEGPQSHVKWPLVAGNCPSVGSLGRCASTAALYGKPNTTTSDQPGTSKAEPSALTLIDRLRRRRSSQGDVDRHTTKHDSFVVATNQLVTRKERHETTKRPATAGAAQPSPVKRTVVEKLLESDASYQLQLQILRDEMRVLEKEKLYFDNHIAKMRKKLRGVNAVHENDVAVAHCSAIMHARIAKAEEEYMKLVTAQQQVKTDIDTLRRELLAMRKVKKKLEDDIADVEDANAAVEDKVRASKGVRNVLSQELVELERRAEITLEEQRLKLPPEEDVVVDAHELMSAVQLQGAAGDSGVRHHRRSTVVLTAGSPLENLQRMLSDRTIVVEVASTDKPLLSFRSAFRVMQQTLGMETHDLDEFVRQFEDTENALLSKHKQNAQLQDEVDQLEREAAKLSQDATIRHATIKGTMHVATAIHQELQDKIQSTLHKIDSYNDLRDERNHEHTRLRGIMQRCLEILHAERLVSSQESLSGTLLLSELTSPAMLEALQKKMTEVAITLKMKHHANQSEGKTGIHSQGEEEAARAARQSGRARSAGSSSAAQRRSNLLAKRETPASKILLGPREPSGAALTSILITAQPPTVEGAQVLTESHANEMQALHPSIMGPIVAAAAMAKPQRRLTISRMSSIRAGKRASALLNSGSNRRISAPPTSKSPTQPPALVTRGSRGSAMWPLRKTDTTDSLIQPEDAHARVIDNTDELDE